ncbi:MAG: dNTP triphosphohydrolase [candidate division KSB1 bacterium]|nr:dNTP triphosphohydrolase [candidate division KSB1 bacterium]
MNTFNIRTREELEKTEQQTLAPYATLSAGTHQTRFYPEPEHPYRLAFQRDRDRIIHSRAFRRLKHKRQVFLTSEGDHYRTRLTHTLEVSQISRTMAKTLGLNEELVEAIALGHDLGHTPFGHYGGVILDNIMRGKDTLDGLLLSRNVGGFKHNYQSLRVVDMLEQKYPFPGLNLTRYVREGILKHTHLESGKFHYPDLNVEGLHLELPCATTLEGQVVAIADEIAQRTHDLEDGIRAGFVELQQVRELPIVKLTEEKLKIADLLSQDPYLYRNTLIKGLINLLVDDVIHQTLKSLSSFWQRKNRTHFFDEELVTFTDELDPYQKQLDEFIAQKIIAHSGNSWADSEVENLLRSLFRAYFLKPLLLPSHTIKRFLRKRGERYFAKAPNSVRDDQAIITLMQQDEDFLRLVCDQIAGMSDNFAVAEYNRLALTKD